VRAEDLPAGRRTAQIHREEQRTLYAQAEIKSCFLCFFNQQGKTPMDLVLQWQNGTKEIFNSLKDNSYKSVHLGKF